MRYKKHVHHCSILYAYLLKTAILLPRVMVLHRSLSSIKRRISSEMHSNKAASNLVPFYILTDKNSEGLVKEELIIKRIKIYFAEIALNYFIQIALDISAQSLLNFLSNFANNSLYYAAIHLLGT